MGVTEIELLSRQNKIIDRIKLQNYRREIRIVRIQQRYEHYQVVSLCFLYSVYNPIDILNSITFSLQVC